MLEALRRLFDRNRPSLEPVVNTLATGIGPRLLLLSATKRNQNWYRDLELARRTRCLFLAENFDYSAHGFDAAAIVHEYFGATKPDYVFVNYHRSYTHRVNGLDELGVPIFGFVGDHYDFTADSEWARHKQRFFRSLGHLAAMVSAYPHTNAEVAQALGRPDLPFVSLPWAVDPAVFRDVGMRRRHDIACLGALTEGKYPFRRQVRTWLEHQRELRLFPAKRVGDHDGVRFNRALNTTRSAFSCALVTGYTVMKYFEIPAAGALLFGEEAPLLPELGYVDGVNYVRVTPEDFADRFRHYLKGGGRADAERIRAAGCELVRTEHTWARRVDRLLERFAALA